MIGTCILLRFAIGSECGRALVENLNDGTVQCRVLVEHSSIILYQSLFFLWYEYSDVIPPYSEI